MTQCVECSEQIDFQAQPMISEIVTCSHCRTELEVLSVEPVKLVKAPEIEEDWGE